MDSEAQAIEFRVVAPQTAEEEGPLICFEKGILSQQYSDSCIQCISLLEVCRRG